MIYISQSTNPFINLSLEHHLFETTNLPALFLYQNTPCVVIGRAQNPWVEANVKFLQEHNIDLLRRQSGGGTVFHDLGNLNFTFFNTKTNYDKKANMHIIIKALASLGAEVEMNERHDLFLQNKKISGSAFRETRDKAFHHATLLINSNLDLLRASLKAPNHQIESKGVASVRSSVINLTEVYPQLEINNIINAIKKTYKEYYRDSAMPHPSLVPEEINLNQSQAPNNIINLYKEDAWRFEKTLPFCETITHKDQSKSILHVEAGIIKKIDSHDPQLLSWLNQPYNNFYSSRL